MITVQVSLANCQKPGHKWHECRSRIRDEGNGGHREHSHTGQDRTRPEVSFMAINDDKSSKKTTDDNHCEILASLLDDDEIEEMKAWVQSDERAKEDKEEEDRKLSPEEKQMIAQEKEPGSTYIRKKKINRHKASGKKQDRCNQDLLKKQFSRNEKERMEAMTEAFYQPSGENWARLQLEAQKVKFLLSGSIRAVARASFLPINGSRKQREDMERQDLKDFLRKFAEASSTPG
jgi:hypothetical protein